MSPSQQRPARRRRVSTPALWMLLVVMCPSLGLADPTLDSSAIGERIYREGILPSGALLRGDREGGLPVEGQAAACVQCHRRSGLGAAEGQSVVPPITARYLYRPNGDRPEDMDYSYVQPFRLNRDPYPNDEAVAGAIRTGAGKGGKTLGYLMPRFELDDAAMAALLQYLHGLSREISPGVTDDTIHFATIITPDADPVARQGMLDVLTQFIKDKNDFVRGGHRPLKSSRDIRFRVSRRWQLHVWNLTGSPDTWQEQLHRHLLAEPVFAVLSGLGGSNWIPVHRFCEAEAIPCLFPNVSTPVVAENDFYPVYFSKGVRLEAELIADRVRRLPEKGAPRRLVQVLRTGSAGEAGAAALVAALAHDSVEVVTRRVDAADRGPGVARALGAATSRDVLVLWLSAADLARLPDARTAGPMVFVSGTMGGMEEAPLPPGWRRATLMAYPVDLPDQRHFRVDFPLGWFRIHKIPVTAERVQADTYVACGIVSEMLNDMLDSFYRDYLLERLESMLSRRTLTGFYPRLSLAPGQRFASKGGYLVHFVNPEGSGIAADTEWTVP